MDDGPRPTPPADNVSAKSVKSSTKFKPSWGLVPKSQTSSPSTSAPQLSISIPHESSSSRPNRKRFPFQGTPGWSLAANAWPGVAQRGVASPAATEPLLSVDNPLASTPEPHPASDPVPCIPNPVQPHVSVKKVDTTQMFPKPISLSSDSEEHIASSVYPKRSLKPGQTPYIMPDGLSAKEQLERKKMLLQSEDENDDFFWLSAKQRQRYFDKQGQNADPRRNAQKNYVWMDEKEWADFSERKHGKGTFGGSSTDTSSSLT